MSLKQRFNTDWKFAKQEIGCNYTDLDSSSILWQPVDIPHDWLIYQDDLYESSEGWYQKNFFYSPVENQLLSLCFDGVYMNSTLFINQREVGSWQYGYSSFEFEITNFLIPGENEIRLRVKHESPNSRWYSGAGIYRNVWLKTYPTKHFISNSIYISTPKENDNFQLIVSHQLENDNAGIVRHTLLDANNHIVLSNLESDCNVAVPLPTMWSLEHPYLYTLRSELIVDGTVVDTEMNRFGFRALTFDCNKGFFLNGVHTKLNGVCQHHDLGALGSAFNVVAAKRQLLILKQMGVNAIRTSHNIPASELLDLADEMGLLIVHEAFDMWARSKTTYDYSRFFQSESAKDVKSWICRDRNHPCIIMWSIGNEIYDTHADQHGADITRYLMDEVRKYDPRENAAVTIGSNYMPWENAKHCADIVKFAGYNYAEKFYETHHQEHPDWFIYGSETSSVVQSRGIYHFPLSQSILCDDDEQCSALGNSTTSWGAKNMESCILAERDTPFSLGQFIWTGFDYIGEPTPYHTRNSYFGQIDTAGFPKDSFYFYQSAWTNYKDNPMVHIAPYWDFNDGQLIDVRVMSNAPMVELFLNDISLGLQQLEHQDGKKLIGDWQVPYEKGHLYAIAYDENNQIIAEDNVYSFEDASTIELLPDKTSMIANGEDLIFVTICTHDSNGRPVENANNRMHISINGAGRLVGLDNGDSTDIDSYKGASKRLFSGKLLAIVASTLDDGPITLTVTSPELPDRSVEFESFISPEEPTATALLSCFESPAKEEIPIRKIALHSPSGQNFTKKLTSFCVKATAYPTNATYHDLNWQITNNSGIDIKIASLESMNEANSMVRITAHGDGDFRLRCYCGNGFSHAQVLSSLEFNISGLGSLTQNPYEFIFGSLYSSYEGELSNANERGVATANDNKTVVTYDNLDFGDYGSDTLTIPIIEVNNKPIMIQFFEGKTDSCDGTLLGTFTYDKPTIWDVYQEDSFKLNKRLKGVTSISMVVESKIHIKGFSFERKEKSFERLVATDANHIYGDTFHINSDCVEGIGNNVSLEFENMNFGEKGFSKLTICGRCPIDKNTIHIRFHGESGDYNELAEFIHTSEYEEQTFYLSSVTGMQTVTFIFLPGSNFDFKWFHFE